jgi:hypothetical protein
MLDRSTRAHIERELGQLDRLLTDYRDLLHSASDEPGLVDRTALSSVVQSFYQGVESVFQLIAMDRLVSINGMSARRSMLRSTDSASLHLLKNGCSATLPSRGTTGAESTPLILPW